MLLTAPPSFAPADPFLFSHREAPCLGWPNSVSGISLFDLCGRGGREAIADPNFDERMSTNRLWISGRSPRNASGLTGSAILPSTFFFFGLGTATHSRTSWLNLGAGLAACGGCTLPTTGKLTIILPDQAERGRARFLRRRRRLLDDERLEPCTGP